MPLKILRIVGGLIDGIADYVWNSATFSSYDDCPSCSSKRPLDSCMVGKNKRARLCLNDGAEQQTAPADWSAMPLDLLRTIASSIDGIEDYIRFRAVCKPWNSAATSSSYDECPRSSKRRLEYPWLMLAPSTTTEDTRRGFYSLHTGKEFYLDLPEIHHKVCLGTPCGRLLTIDRHRNMHLFNPLTRQHLPLPSLTITGQPIHYPYISGNPFLASNIRDLHTRDTYPLYEAMMSVNRALVVWDDDTPIVFVNYWYKKLAMARAGDTSWTHIECCDYRIESIELFRGQVLAVTAKGIPTDTWKIHMVDLSHSPPRLKEFASSPSYYCVNHFLYLVDMGGVLHALDCTYKGSPCINQSVKQKFSVFKFDMADKSWEKVHTLGGWTAFVGRSSSFALPSSTNYPLCRPNCIYFTDDLCMDYHIYGRIDLGTFSVKPEEEGEGNRCKRNGCEEDHSLEEDDLNVMRRCPFPIYSDLLSKDCCPPLWLAPNLW